MTTAPIDSKITTSVPIESIITTALLVPLGDGHPSSGPETPNCTWGLPVLLWGPPGIGKSFRVKAAGAAARLSVRTVFAATRAPEDFSGVPVMHNGTFSVECILGAVRELCQIDRGILFLDEITCAVPSVQAALLGVVLDRVVGDTKIPAQVRIIAAANPANEAAGGWDLEPPLANRFAHFYVSAPSTVEWVKWMLGDFENKSEDTEFREELIKTRWPESFAKAKGIIAGFFKHFPDDRLFKLPKQGDKARGQSWPSPRTWEMAMRSIATCYALLPSDADTDAKNLNRAIQQDMVGACVGQGVAIEWAEWVAKADLPDPVDVVLNGWKPDERRLDRTLAVVTAVAQLAVATTDPELRMQYAVGAWKLFGKAKEAGLVDLVLPGIRTLSNGKLGVMDNPNSEITTVASPILGAIQHSGLVKLVKAP